MSRSRHSIRFVVLSLLSLMLVLLSACGSTPAATPAETTVAVATTAPTAAAPTEAAPTTVPSEAPMATVAEPTEAPATATSAPEVTPTEAATATVEPEATAAASEPATLTVFAAASLTDAFGEIGNTFESEHPGVTVSFNFAGSNQLAQQITEGAPADVFASANKTQMDVVINSGQIITGTQHTFVRNRLVVIYPNENPGGLATLKDLAKPGLKLVLANKAVPVGQYALDFLGKASKTPEYTEAFSETVVANVVSYEENVRAVLSKVALGEADAGIVYSSDVTGDSASSVTRLDIPDELNTIASYPIAPVKDSPNATLAQEFVNYILSPAAQTVLVKYGFISTTGSATGETPAGGLVEIKGLVSTPVTLSVDDLKAKPQIEVKATDRDGAEQTFMGVSLATLLDEAGVDAAAKEVVFTGGDGYQQTLALDVIRGDEGAIIALLDDGSVRTIIPSQLPRFWIKGLTTIEAR